MITVDPSTGRVTTLVDPVAVALAERIDRTLSSCQDSQTAKLICDILNFSPDLAEAYAYREQDLVVPGTVVYMDKTDMPSITEPSTVDFVRRVTPMIIESMIHQKDFNLMISGGEVTLFYDDKMIKI